MNDAFEGKSCNLIEVTHPITNRNHFIAKERLAQWINDQRDDVDLYSSFFRYYTDDPNVGPVLAGFGMDFDSLTNPEKARKEALAVCRYLLDRFSLKTEDLSVCFSGSKGFHVFVNHACFGIEPYYWLPQVFKAMARELIHELNLKTLDLAIYDRRRLIRLPNTRHGGSMLYKTPLSLYELEHSTVTTIKALAVKSRSLLPPKPHEVSEKGTRWLQQHKKTFQQALESKREEFTDSDFQFKGLLPCVKKRLEEGAKEGMRNRYSWQLASYFCHQQTSLPECLGILKKWWSLLPQAPTAYTWNECEATIRKTYDVSGYQIGCGSEYAEGLCVGRDACPLFNVVETTEISEEAKLEAKKILLADPLKYIADTVNTVHVGDRELIKIAYISALSPRLSNSIHLWPIGTSQKGKSHVLKNILPILPRENYESFTSASPKSLFYFCKKYGDEAFNGRVIYIDEIEGSKNTLPMLRTLTSQTDIEPRHLSVYDAELLDLKIKGPRVIWFTSVKAFGADQLRNRFVFVNPDESTEQDEAVYELQKRQDINVNLAATPSFQAAQALTKKIIEDTESLAVTITYIDAIQWPYKDKRWLFPIFKSFLEIITKIHYKQRKTSDNMITSTSQDFEDTKILWAHFIESIIYRVSEPAKKILDILESNSEEAMTKAEISDEIGKSTQYISKLMVELDEGEMINKQKRQKQGAGRLAWEYWKAKLPNIDDIRILNFETSETQIQDDENFSKKNGNIEIENQSSKVSKLPRCAICNIETSDLAPDKNGEFMVCRACRRSQAS